MSDGECLRHAFEEMMRRDERGEKVVYVQGTVTNPHTGKTFAHAWVENTREAIDPTIDLILPKRKYYSTFKPEKVIRLEPAVAALLILKYKHKFFPKAEAEATAETVRKYEESLRKRKQS